MWPWPCSSNSILKALKIDFKGKWYAKMEEGLALLQHFVKIEKLAFKALLLETSNIRVMFGLQVILLLILQKLSPCQTMLLNTFASSLTFFSPSSWPWAKTCFPLLASSFYLLVYKIQDVTLRKEIILTQEEGICINRPEMTMLIFEITLVAIGNYWLVPPNTF